MSEQEKLITTVVGEALWHIAERAAWTNHTMLMVFPSEQDVVTGIAAANNHPILRETLFDVGRTQWTFGTGASIKFVALTNSACTSEENFFKDVMWFGEVRTGPEHAPFTKRLHKHMEPTHYNMSRESSPLWMAVEFVPRDALESARAQHAIRMATVRHRDPLHDTKLADAIKQGIRVPAEQYQAAVGTNDASKPTGPVKIADVVKANIVPADEQAKETSGASCNSAVESMGSMIKAEQEAKDQALLAKLNDNVHSAQYNLNQATFDKSVSEHMRDETMGALVKLAAANSMGNALIACPTNNDVLAASSAAMRIQIASKVETTWRGATITVSGDRLVVLRFFRFADDVCSDVETTRWFAFYETNPFAEHIMFKMMQQMKDGDVARKEPCIVPGFTIFRIEATKKAAVEPSPPAEQPTETKVDAATVPPVEDAHVDTTNAPHGAKFESTLGGGSVSYGPVKFGPDKQDEPGQKTLRRIDNLLREAIKHVDDPNHRALIVAKNCREVDRRIMPRLSEVWGHAGGKPTTNYCQSGWTFPSGAKVDIFSMADNQEKVDLHGDYNWVGVDRLSLFTNEDKAVLKRAPKTRGCLRGEFMCGESGTITTCEFVTSTHVPT